MSHVFDDLKAISKYLLFPVIVFITHILLLFGTQIYEIYPWLDIPMHILGGFAFGFVFIFSLKYFQKKGYIFLNRMTLFVFTVSMVALVAVLWEFFEFGLEYLFEFDFQGTLNDTMFDLAMGLLGAILSILFFEK